MTSVPQNGTTSEGTRPASPRTELPIPGGRRRITPSSGLFLILATACIALAATIVVADIDRLTVGLLTVPLTVLLLLCGVHVAAAMALGGLLGLWKLGGMAGVGNALSTIPHTTVASWSLTVIPMFILMGIVLYRTGIIATLFDAARKWLGRVPGGLAVATNVSGAGLAAASGSTLGIAFALGRLAIPEMIKARYAPSLATGVVAMAGTLGQIIPPSVIMVIYAGVAQTPVGPQLLAGVIPGILLACMFAVMIVIRAKVTPALAPPTDKSQFPIGERMRSLASIWPLPVLVLVVIGGLYSGLATATEAGALGALAAIMLGFWRHRAEGFRATCVAVGRSLAETAAAVAAIMLLLVGVHILTRLVALSRIAQEISQVITDLGVGRIGLLFILIALYLVLGMFMDTLAMVLLTVPILLPVLENLDIDLLWFGVFVILMAEIAMVTPPVGVVAFVVHGLSQNKDVNLGENISLGVVFRGCLWFVVTALVLAVVLIFVPDLALWLPTSGLAQ